jgi:hydroxymethylpyrimidine pyrophosphatase-like HAD family hydrolase
MTAAQEDILADITFFISQEDTVHQYDLQWAASNFAIVRDNKEIIYEFPVDMPAHIIGGAFLEYCEDIKNKCFSAHAWYYYRNRKHYGACPRTFIERLID